MMKLVKNNISNMIWRYYALQFFGAMHFFSAVLVPFFTDWGGITMAQVQLLQSWFMLCFFLLEIPTGAVADFIGRKHSLTLGAIIIALGALVYGSIPNFYIFMLGEFLFGMGLSLISGADKALVYDTLKEQGREEESKKIFGRAHAYHMAGIFAASATGGFIAAKFGLNAPMLFTVITAFITAGIAWSLKEPVLKDKQKESKRYTDIVKKGAVYFYQHKQLRSLAIDGILVMCAAYFVIWLYQPMLKNAGVPIQYFGLVHASFVAIQMLIAANFSLLEKLAGSSARLLKITALLTGLSFIAVSFNQSLYMVAVFLIFAGGFGLTRLELLTAQMNKFIPSEQRATILSSISMFRRFTLVILNPIVGFTVDRSFSLALFGIGLIPILVFLFSPLKKEMLED